MKSVKPGCGPSMLGGVVAVAMAIFGVFWCVMAAGIGAGFMSVFGIVFILIAIATAIYHFRNATGEQRYSTFDIVDADEEGDPLNERFGRQQSDRPEEPAAQRSDYCPYCGTPVDGDYRYCRRCGRELP